MDTQTFIWWARQEQNRISQESMQERQRMEALLNEIHLRLGEANGRMKMLDSLIDLAERGILPGTFEKGIVDECDLPHSPTGVVDTDEQRVE